MGGRYNRRYHSGPSSHGSIPRSIFVRLSVSHTLDLYASDISRKKMVHTNIMATLNFAPDSFSDIAQHSHESASTIVDIDGYPSRPGSTFVG